MKNDIIQSNIKRLSFLQLIRLLRLSENDIKVLFKKLHISPHLSLGFTTCDFEEINFNEANIEIICNFLGTYGTSSVLPTFYTEELLKHASEENHILQEFYNIFSRRTYQLLGEITIKNRLMLRIAEFKDKEALDFVYSFLGLNYTDKQNIKYIDKFRLLKYIDILTNSSKSTNMLETLLSDYLNITVRIKEHLKIKVQIPENQLNSLKKENTTIGTLYLGKKINDINSSCKVILEELSEIDFNELLPNNQKFLEMIELINLYFGDLYERYIIEYQKSPQVVELKNGSYLNKKMRLGMNINLGQNTNYIYNCKNLNLL